LLESSAISFYKKGALLWLVYQHQYYDYGRDKHTGTGKKTEFGNNIIKLEDNPKNIYIFAPYYVYPPTSPHFPLSFYPQFGFSNQAEKKFESAKKYFSRPA